MVCAFKSPIVALPIWILNVAGDNVLNLVISNGYAFTDIMASNGLLPINSKSLIIAL